jgi:hypothetical protein
VKGLEQKVTVTYEKMPNNVHMVKLTTKKNINHIMQKIDQYQQEIENIHEKLTPTTPPKIREKRKPEDT